MKTDIQFDTDATTGDDCVILFAASGSKEAIREKLLLMALEINDEEYPKPIQGIISSFSLTSHVITPIWGGKEY